MRVKVQSVAVAVLSLLAPSLMGVIADLQPPALATLTSLLPRLPASLMVGVLADRSGPVRRRSSEVHALSGAPNDITFESDGSVSLRFLPEFLSKNQVPGNLSPIIPLRPLTSILAPDDPDRALCPVRALRC